MDIKEIAKRIRKTNNSYMLSMSPDIAAEFAEALISAYKAELMKEVGEPVLYAEFAEDGGWLGDASEYADHLEEPHALFTSDQVAAAILKATKPPEEEVERLKGMVSEIQAARHVHQEHNRLLTQLAAAQEEIDQARRTAEYWKAEHLAANNQLAKAEQRYLAWEGGEEWEQLAFQLCADECGEESCNELIWEGCPPEPWGERWLKYESEAKRIIQLVRQYAPDKKAEQRVAEACATLCNQQAERDAEHQKTGNQCDDYISGYEDGSGDCANSIDRGEWRKFVKEV